MAIFTYGNIGVGVNMAKASVASLFDYDFWRASSTKITMYDDSSNMVTFSGARLTFMMKNGDVKDVTAGTLTGVKFVIDGKAAWTVSGLNVSAVKLGDAIFARNDKAFIDILMAGNDLISGTSKGDTLLGGGGSDVLKGNAGNDKLFGGAGADDLFGGTGADRFSFSSLSDSTSVARDSVFDFSRSEGDKIDLSAIDANKNASGNQAFKFIASEKFHGKAGELRFEKKASDTYVYVDVNGDKKVDFTLHFDDPIALKATDFVL
ncbi:calcium-binding protein [Pararhizobium antarcticum]|uniref:Peptidase M10 serralysin C-terminal domain-containing protein n=1 Tax=Pararhizobium antarcticum TaxID=1798805 RepID=A0A657LXL9_9HYPH|nr:hypothetical protein [Pararhizobium antarcticum]OJF95166.1 hypothetical protein AX761_18210 [Rhizobium sp. 58]OJG00749.1 hypothetical protein AX760_09770 [Pararhizobium antarcticum]